MSATTLPIYAGCALLIVVAALPVLSRFRVTATFALIAGWLVVGLLLTRWFVRTQQYFPDTEPSKIVRYGTKALIAAKKNPAPNLLIVEGGSYAAQGVNPNVLKNQLRKLGYRARVVQLALGGGNHFERYQLLADLLDGPQRPAFSKKSNLVFMAETQINYDAMPLSQLEENLDTARAYHYLTPTSAFDALWALWAGGGKTPHLEEPVWPVVRHAMVNGFNVGLLRRLKPWAKISPRGGFVNRGRNRRFRFKGLRPVMAAVNAPLTNPFDRPWVLSIREARLRALWGERLDHWVYFGVPSTTAKQMLWMRTFCGVTDKPCIAANDLKLVKELDTAKMWYDAGHLTKQGSVVYSRWLAQALVNLGVLKK